MERDVSTGMLLRTRKILRKSDKSCARNTGEELVFCLRHLFSAPA